MPVNSMDFDKPTEYSRSALISACGAYRYRLTRTTGPWGRVATFVMLNPSTADAMIDDPTIRRCIGYARAWRCGTLRVVNLFAFRATSPADMRRARDPVGPDNAEHIAWGCAPAGRTEPIEGGRQGIVVCAWGALGSFMDQDRTVLGWLDEWGITPHCLRQTRHGQPCHPLYLPATLEPTAFRGRG